MKTEVKKVDSSTRELSIEVSGDVVKGKFEDVFQRITQEAKVPGFRVGHAPRDMIEKHYSANAHEQVVKELVPDLYHQAVEKEGLDVVGLPDITDVKLDRSSLSFKASVEISPEIPVKNYRGIKVKYTKASVSPEEIKRQLDSLKEAQKAEALDDSFARGMGYPDVAELERSLSAQLMLQKENAERQRIEHEIIEAVMKGLDFKPPQSLVQRQLNDLLRQTKLDLTLKGVPREKIGEQEKALQQQLDPEARRQVKVYLVLAAVARKEGIAPDEQMPRKVIELLLKSADWQTA